MTKQYLLVVDTWDKFQEAKGYLSDVSKEDGRLAVDTETCGKHGAPLDIKPALRHDNLLLGVSISKDPNSGIYLPYYANPKKQTIWTNDQFIETRSWLKDWFMSDVGWIMHNSIFDLRVLKNHIVRPRNLVMDTQIACHEADENLPLGLKEQGQIRFGINAKAEKNAMMAWAAANPTVFGSAKPSVEAVMGQLWKLPLSLVGEYACKDTMLTFGLYQEVGKELVAKGLVKRYKAKHKLIPVYEEINSQGWAIDKQILVDNGNTIRAEIEGYFEAMYALLEAPIKAVEREHMDKTIGIKQSVYWKRNIIELEGFESQFTVPENSGFFKNGKPKPPKKDAGKFTTNAIFCEAFLDSPESAGTMTAEFLKWDGKDVATLSERTMEELLRAQMQRGIAARVKVAKDQGKVVCHHVFNFNSDKQIQNLLFDKLKLRVVKVTDNTGAPDVSSDVLKKLQLEVLKKLAMDNKFMNMKDSLTRRDLLATNAGDTIDFSQPQPVNISAKKRDYYNYCVVLFLSTLRELRDRDKVYNTYILGIIKQLYTHTDLKRKAEINPSTGNTLHYVISNVNMTGTKTGRPSSNCLVGSTMIGLADGSVKQIKDLVRDQNDGKHHEVITHKERTRKVTAVFDNGKQEVFRITISDGRTVECTAHHKFLTRSKKGGLVWKELQHLNAGDSILERS